MPGTSLRSSPSTPPATITAAATMRPSQPTSTGGIDPGLDPGPDPRHSASIGPSRKPRESRRSDSIRSDWAPANAGFRSALPMPKI
jgi:hypothetical protein